MIGPTRLVRQGVVDEDLLADLTGRMRSPAQRRADLRAQLASARTGEARLAALVERSGRELPRRGDRGHAGLRRAAHARPDRGDGGRAPARRGTFSRRPTGDLELVLAATVDGDSLTLDFTGSADQHPGNLNCPLAVTLSACYFAVRVLADPDVPACAGAWRPVEVIAPGGIAAERQAARGRRGRQRGDLLARRRPGAGRVRARARSGHDEQPHARQRPLHLLRDPRRRAGRLRGRRRARARCTWP